MGRRAVAAGAVLLLLLAACGRYEEDGGGEGDPPDAGSTASTSDASDWCDEFDALEDPGDLGGIDLSEVPEEIRAPIERLIDSDDVRADLAAGTLEPGAFTELMAAFSEVVAWAHEHCGADDPFCLAWIGVSATMAEYALAAGGEDPPLLDLDTYLSELEPVLKDYVPPDLRDELETVLASLRAPSDEDELAAEAANDALDEWTRSEGCDGAPAEDGT